MKSTAEIVSELQNLTRGLYCLKEKEFPFQVEVWEMSGKVSEEQEVLKRLSHIENPVPEETELEVIFRDDVQVYADATPAEQARALRYQALVHYIRTTFATYTVYKVGHDHQHIFILGNMGDPDEAIVLHTLGAER